MKSFNKMVAMLLLTVVSFGANAYTNSEFLKTEKQEDRVKMIETLLKEVGEKQCTGLGKATGINWSEFYALGEAKNEESGLKATTVEAFVFEKLSKEASTGFIAAAKNVGSIGLSAVTYPFRAAWNNKKKVAAFGGTVLAGVAAKKLLTKQAPAKKSIFTVENGLGVFGALSLPIAYGLDFFGSINQAI